MTGSETAHRTPHAGRPANGGVNASMRATARASVTDPTARTERHERGWKALLDDLTPPTVWTDRPASLKELTLYARYATWSAKDGFWRNAGIAWCWLIGIPASTVAYYAAWTVQRPGRALTVLLLYAVLAHTGLGGWLLPYPDWLP